LSIKQSVKNTRSQTNKTDIENKKIKHLMQLPYGNGYKDVRYGAIVDHLLVCPKRNEKPSIQEFSIVCKAFKSYKARKIYEVIKFK